MLPNEPMTVPAPDRPKATPSEIFSWIFMACALVFTLEKQLLPALLAGLFVYSMVHRIAVRLILYKILHKHAKLAAMLILSLAVIGVSTLIVLAVIGIARGHVGGINDMIKQMLSVVESKREWFTDRGIGVVIPEPEKLYAWVYLKLDRLKRELESPDTFKMALYALVGIIIGALLSFKNMLANGPLAVAFFERVRRFSTAFEAVIFAQVKISALNTLFTAIYLLVVLPACGVDLPLRSTLLMVTFLFGMLPVVGNLMSNAVIVMISLGIAPGVALASLTFLIVIHKFEYFLNAKIVGGHIGAAAWEILLVMLCMEAVFGIQGVILAPVAYAYFKAELKARGMI